MWRIGRFLLDVECFVRGHDLIPPETLADWLGCCDFCSGCRRCGKAIHVAL